MKQNTIIIILTIALIGLGAFVIFGKDKKKPKGLPMPDAIEVADTVAARAMYVDSTSDLVHYNTNSFVIRRGYINPKTKQFINPPQITLLDENKKRIPKVKAIL